MSRRVEAKVLKGSSSLLSFTTSLLKTAANAETVEVEAEGYRATDAVAAIETIMRKKAKGIFNVVWAEEYNSWMKEKLFGTIIPDATIARLESASDPAAEGRKLELLGSDDATANREYVKQLVFRKDRELGRKYNLEYAEQFHYIGPEEDALGKYVREHSVPR